MVPTSANYLQLLTDFPEAELRYTPPTKENTRTPVTGQVELGLMREFERIANDTRGSTSVALEEALSEWVSKNRTDTGMRH